MKKEDIQFIILFLIRNMVKLTIFHNTIIYLKYYNPSLFICISKTT